jgi:hypothetical protein
LKELISLGPSLESFLSIDVCPVGVINNFWRYSVLAKVDKVEINAWL